MFFGGILGIYHELVLELSTFSISNECRVFLDLPKNEPIDAGLDRHLIGALF